MIPIVSQKTVKNSVFPTYQNINEDKFKNWIVTEKRGSSTNEGFGKINTDNRGRKTKYGRSSVGSLITGLPSTTNFNHHYGIFFNKNSSTKRSSDNSLKDKKRMKNLKHIKKIWKDKKGGEGINKFFQPLTERHHYRQSEI